MTEQVKKNTSAWMMALKEYNDGRQWCVPKKDTPEYLAVKEIADRIKSEIIKATPYVEETPEEEPPVKKARKVRIKKVAVPEAVPSEAPPAPVKKPRRKKSQVSPEDESSYN